MNAVTEYDHPGNGGDLVVGVGERPHVLHSRPAGGVRPVLVAEGGSDGGLSVSVDLRHVPQSAAGPRPLTLLLLPHNELGLLQAGQALLVLSVTVIVRVAGDDLSLLPRLGIHEDLEEPLDDEEEVEAGPDGERDVEVTVVGVHLNVRQPAGIKHELSYLILKSQ